jgi:hypothetical protein
VDQVVGLDGVRSDIAMMRTPDGHGRLELSTFHAPTAITRSRERAGEHAGYRPPSCSPSTTSTSPCPPAGSRRQARRRSGAVRGPVPALLPPRPRGHPHRAGRAARLNLYTSHGQHGCRRGTVTSSCRFEEGQPSASAVACWTCAGQAEPWTGSPSPHSPAPARS